MVTRAFEIVGGVWLATLPPSPSLQFDFTGEYYLITCPLTAIGSSTGVSLLSGITQYVTVNTSDRYTYKPDGVTDLVYLKWFNSTVQPEMYDVHWFTIQCSFSGGTI